MPFLFHGSLYLYLYVCICMCLSIVRLEERTAESANDSPPGLTIHRHVAETRGSPHVRHPRAGPTARADPRRWLAAPRRPPLVHQKAHEHQLLLLSQARTHVHLISAL
ncbi:unnamed protein product [Musa acuminata subsp. burmannicoides]